MAATGRWCALLALLFAGAVQPAAAATAPPVEPLPWSMHGPGSIDLKGIACPTANRCVAVGSIAGQVSAPLVANYTSGHWRQTILPIPPGGAYAWFEDVSCPATTWCAATGISYASQYVGVPFAAIFSDGQWTELTMPRPAAADGVSINDISCPVTGNCVAVGGYTDSSDHNVSLIESLSGATWSIVDLPPTANTSADLRGVDCSAAGACTAVGKLNDRRLIADTLSGSTWSSASLPRPTGFTSVTPDGVSCAAADSCTLVGTYTDAAFDAYPFADSLAAGTWTASSLPQPPSDSVQDFAGISCPDTSHCVAVGSGYSRPFVETLTDTSWDSASLPVPSIDSTINGIACHTAARCTAVGWTSDYPTNPALADTLVSGTWTASEFHLPGAPDAFVEGVSCRLEITNCLAIGAALDSSSDPRVMTEARGSSGWTAASPSFAGTYLLDVYGIGCPVAGPCVSIARAIVNGSDSLVAYTREHGAWHETLLPVSTSTVYHVSPPVCPKAGSCVAVASYLGHNSNVRNVALTLADGTWTVTNLPVPAGGQYPFITAVSCASVASCVAVGDFESASSNALYADRLAHGSWTATELSLPADASSPILAAISCPTSTWCTAVGSSANQPIVETYSGGTWTGFVLPLPVGSHDESLASVSCAVTGACTAVGVDTDNTGTQVERPLLDTLTSDAWQPSILANPASGTDAELRGVSCIADQQCVGVGSYAGWDGGEHPFAITQN